MKTNIIQKDFLLINNFFRAQNEKNVMSGAVADPIWPEPESAPEPRTSGVAKKSGRSRSASSSIWTRSGSRGKSNKPNFKRFITKFSQMLNKI